MRIIFDDRMTCFYILQRYKTGSMILYRICDLAAYQNIDRVFAIKILLLPLNAKHIVH